MDGDISDNQYSCESVASALNVHTLPHSPSATAVGPSGQHTKRYPPPLVDGVVMPVNAMGEVKESLEVVDVRLTNTAPPGWDAVQEVKEREVRVRCAFADTNAERAPPRPLDAEQERKEAEESVKSHSSGANSKTAPFPVERVMEEKFVSEKERMEGEEEEEVVSEMRGEEEEEVSVKRVKLQCDVLSVPPLRISTSVAATSTAAFEASPDFTATSVSSNVPVLLIWHSLPDAPIEDLKETVRWVR